MNRGLLAAITAFLFWGFLPLYLRELHGVSALQVMASRLSWCCLFVNLWLIARGEFGALRTALAVPETRWRLLASALLISFNWLLFVWSVDNAHVLEASLGYFINPLMNVLLGVLVLREKLNRPQQAAIALAAAGVLYLTWLSGTPPWIALALGATFSVYGLVRKTVKVEAVVGLGAETALIFPIALAYMVWLEAQGAGAMRHGGAYLNFMLVLGGVITGVPLALFAYGARLIPYSTMGLVQYIGPTLQLMFGVFVFHEPFTPARAIGFGLIWIALLIYVAEGLARTRRLKLLEQTAKGVI